MFSLIEIVYSFFIQKMSGSHGLSTIEPLIPSSSNSLLTPTSGDRSHSPEADRNLCVMLDDRGKINPFNKIKNELLNVNHHFFLLQFFFIHFLNK